MTESKGDEEGSIDRESDEFRMEITEADHYQVYPASSVRGGVQIKGDFLFEFFIERYQDPGAEVYSITEEGEIGEHLRREAYDGALVREKQAGIMMSQNNAFDLATWVIANLLGEGVTDADVEDVIIEEFSKQLETTDESE